MKAVDRLPEGWTVRFKHHRAYKKVRPGRFDEHVSLSEQGGSTQARVFNTQGVLVAVGHARCHPNDSFNRKIGREVSLGRALSALESGDPTRRELRVGPGLVGEGHRRYLPLLDETGADHALHS